MREAVGIAGNKRLNEIISLIFMPQISSSYAFALLFFGTGANWICLALAIFFSSVVQIISIAIYSVISGGDVNVDNIKGRSWLFAIAIVSYFLGFFLLVHLSAPYIMSVLMLSYALNTVVAAVITRYITKVSIHVWGLSGPSVTILYVYGPLWFLSMLAVAWIVGNARVGLRKHTWIQVFSSFALSLCITGAIVYLIGPIML